MTSKLKSRSGRLFAIGDIHGCPDELATMLRRVDPKREDTVVFVGDYVDRGPSSRDVVEQLLALKQESACETIFLKGNHEDMLLSFLGLPGRFGESFLFNGGAATLDSYGVTETELDRVTELIPEKHLAFFSDLAISYLNPPYLFVHAGVMPTRQLDEQVPEDMLWIRQEFIFNPHHLGHTVVFGHTPMKSVMLDLPYKIGIDTGLVYGNKLTCIEFREGLLYQVGRNSREAKLQHLEHGRIA
ncbi:MAG TPA: metallophosphoesterase family protein [Candidatus Binataceae bacterium]|jgi:serine/threonine protein phosphatase 1